MQKSIAIFLAIKNNYYIFLGCVLLNELMTIIHKSYILKINPIMINKNKNTVRSKNKVAILSLDNL